MFLKRFFRQKTQSKSLMPFDIKGITFKKTAVAAADSIDLRFDKIKPQIIDNTGSRRSRALLFDHPHNGPLRTALQKVATTKGSTRKQSQVGPEPWVYRVSGRSLTPLVSFKFLSLCGFEALCEHLSFLRCCKFIISHLYHSVNSN